MSTGTNPNIGIHFGRSERVVAGVMSGTSVDGVDAVIARISGSGRGLEAAVKAHYFEPYPSEIRKLVLDNSAPDQSSTEQISQINAVLPLFFERAIRGAIHKGGLTLSDVDLVGCHGQTIHHVPDLRRIGDLETRSTLQIGDPAVLAAWLRVPVVGDFRQADMALGGQGAPLVPYLDYVLFGDEREARVMLNLGGIANVTFLAAGCGRDQVIAFDTGPANMVIDGLTERFFGLPYDEAGRIAARSKPDLALLGELLADEYVRRAPPKSTGRERYGREFVDRLCRQAAARLGPEPEWGDAEKSVIVSTATAFTASSVKAGIDSASNGNNVSRVIVSGGGTRNDALMAELRRILQPAEVETIDSYGIRSSEKEALCFAVLAHELMNGVATGMPSVTGASASAMQGKICLPS